jgi:integrase
MFMADGTKISMPPMKQKDAEQQKEVKVYEQYQLAAIETVLKDTDAYIPFLLGFYCGLRIGECFGLMWDDLNWHTKELRINKKMQVIDGVTYLRPTKTKAGCRTIEVPPIVMDALQKLHRKQFKKPSAKFRANKCEKVILVTDNKQTNIIGGDFINRRVSGPFEGCIMTPNCMKMYAKEIDLGEHIHFEYHSLRRTHITQLINNGVPLKEVSKRVGHTKVSTTLKSYAGSTDETKQIMRDGLNKLNTVEPLVEIPTGNGGTRMIKQSEQAKLNAMLAAIPH